MIPDDEPFVYSKPHKPDRTQTTKGDDTVKWLEDHCGFRPIGAEW